MNIRERFWGTGKRATQEEVIELTNQFYVTLRAYFAQVKRTGAGEGTRNKDAFERIQKLLDATDGTQPIQNWTNAYEVEQLLVHLFDDDTVATELAVRILEARSILRPELATMYDVSFHDIQNPSAAVPPATTAMRRRSLLARLVNDLQWRYIVNEAKRRYSKLITRRTATLSVFALLVFVAVVLIVATRDTSFKYGDLRLLWIASLAGTWGATFSMLATVKTRLDQSKFDDLKLMKAGSVLLSRAAIGAGAASILFFFLLSGLLGGTAFPLLTLPKEIETSRAVARAAAATPTSPQPSMTNSAPPPSSTAERPPALATQTSQGSPTSDENRLPARELAMLIVWCFIAGFSEQLIPGLLASTEARAGTPAQSTTDRFRPTTGATSVPATGGAAQQTANATETAGPQQQQSPPNSQPPPKTE